MKKKLLTIILLMFVACKLSAQQSEVFIKAGNAIGGYDAVAYFKDAKPVKGNEIFSFKWNDANWLFITQQNLDSFKSDPQKFAPQYGGYCAYGISEGHKAPTDPNAWTIVDEKLYFNYNLRVKEMWSKEKAKRIEDANENWLKVKSRE